MFLLRNLKCSHLINRQRSLVQFSTNLNCPNPVEKENSTAIHLEKETYGQPTHYTHPHIVGKGEIAVGVTASEFKERRQRLLASVQKFAVNTQPTLKNHLIIIPSATKKYMSDKIPYVFRQNSDFYYLTGCLEPDSTLLLAIDEKENIQSTLLMRPKDKHSELWDGPRTGIPNSVDYFGVDEAFDASHFKEIVETKMRKYSTTSPLLVWYDEQSSDQTNLSTSLKSLIGPQGYLQNPTKFVHRQRLIKSPAEIVLMRWTCKIASESINETMQETKPGDSEHHIFARVDYKCRMKNASYLAYPPVVASGTNATVIHYINNCQLTKPTDMVLMDAGCEYGGYTSDITRTWPVSGQFSEAQKILYDVTLALQLELIDTLGKEGGRTLDQLFDTMCDRLGQYLQEVGLISKSLTGVSLAKAAYSFCPHHVSHYLGMDVHDTPSISRTMPLLPGMVCTVEPGIYINSDRTDVPPEFRGLGIRIEDDVLINADYSVDVLTGKCIKDRSSLEDLLR